MREAMKLWQEAGYEPRLIESLRWDRSYSIIRIGTSEFAFSTYEGYISALHAAWEAGVVPDHGQGPVFGIDLPDVVPSLRGVDIDVTPQSSPGRGTGRR